MSYSESTFEMDTLKRVLPMTAWLQAGAAGLCLLSQIFMDLYTGVTHISHYLWPALAFCGAAITFRVQSPRAYFWIGIFNLQMLVIGFAVLTSQVPDPDYWLLPIGLCITLTVASLYHHVGQYLWASACTWLTLWLTLQPTLGTELKRIFVPFIMVASMAIGVMANRLLRKYRADSFALQRRLHDEAHTDLLTRLPNRRSFMAAWAVFGQSAQSGAALCFMMLDIDNFKRINDDFGHDVGDEALLRIAGLLRALPPTVTVGRLGGEEFAVLGFLDREGASQLAQSIVHQVHQEQVKDRHLSVSVGVAFQQRDEDFSAVMRRADMALYQAKESGKNQFQWAEQDAL